MRKRDKDALVRAIAERDEARAERDFILAFLAEMGGAFYRGDARAALNSILTLRALVALGADRAARGHG